MNSYRPPEQLIKLKEGVSPEDILMLSPAAFFMLMNVAFWFKQELGRPVIVTSLISDRAGVKAKSRTHATGRAFDISIKGMDKVQRIRFQFYFNKKYSGIAAISSSDNQPRLIVYGDKNHIDHMHVQVKWGIDSLKLLEDYYE